MLNPNFAILGALINLAGCLSYVWDTLRGTTQPNRVGWTLWATAPLVAFAAELSQGVKLQSLITLSAGLGPLLVVLASFVDRKAYWKLRPFDWYCGALSILALVLWWITGKGNVAIVFSIGADLLACLPTVVKSYTHPQSETANAFVAGSVGVLISILAIQHWTFANYAFPLYLLVADSAIASIIIFRGRAKRREAKPAANA